MRFFRPPILALALPLTLVLAMVSAAAQEKAEVYQGDIRESDIRRRELMELLKKDQIPPKLRLRYSRTESDFLVFYDLEGKSIYYQYREDRFDRDAEEKIGDLIPGEAYEVTGTYLGIFNLYEIFSKDNPGYAKLLSSPDAIPAFKYVTAMPLRIDQILF